MQIDICPQRLWHKAGTPNAAIRWNMFTMESTSEIFRTTYVPTWPIPPESGCVAWGLSIPMSPELLRWFWYTIKVEHHIYCVVLVLTGSAAISFYKHILPFLLLLGYFFLSSQLLFTKSISTFKTLKSSAIKTVQWTHKFKTHKQFGGEIMSLFWNKLHELYQVILHTKNRNKTELFLTYLNLFILYFFVNIFRVL